MAQDPPQPPASTPGWHHHRRTAGRGTDPSKRRKTLVAIVTVMAILGALIYILIKQIDPFRQPFFLSIPVTEYSRHYPPNPFAVQDSDLLIAHFPRPSDAKKSGSQQKQRFQEEITRLEKSEEKVVVVHLCALALARGDKVYVLPKDADPDRPDSWLLLTDILAALERCPAPNKLLILDVMRPMTGARLGVLANDVPAKVHALLQERTKAGELPFFVLCACAPEQQSWTSKELKGSVFAYYLAEGLRGWAKNYHSSGEGDSRVWVRELAEFVKTRVDRWAIENRDARQTPVLLGGGQDFPLAQAKVDPSVARAELERQKAELKAAQDAAVAATDQASAADQAKTPKTESPSGTSDSKGKEESKPPPEKVAQELSYPDWLLRGWQERDRHWNEGSYRVIPRAFRQLEASLLLAEQRWRGGRDETSVRTDFDGDLNTFHGALAPVKGMIDVQGPMNQAARTPELENLKKTLGALLSNVDKLPPDEAVKKAPDEDTKKLQAKVNQDKEAFKDKKADVLIDLICEVAPADSVPSKEKLQVLIDLLKGAKPSTEAHELPATIAFLERLTVLPSEEPNHWINVVRYAFELKREARKAGAPGFRVLPWVRQSLDLAAKEQADAEKLLTAADSEALAPASQRLKKALSQYPKINQTIQTIESARLNYDQAFVLLAGYISFLVERPRLETADEALWMEAARATQRLAVLLAKPRDQDPALISQIREQSGKLGQALAKLRASFDKLKEQITTLKDGNAGHYREMQALLDTLVLSAPERMRVLLAQRQLADSLNKATLKLDLEDNARESPRRSSKGSRDASSDSSADSRRGLRARLATELLKLGGLEHINPLEQDMENSSWDALGEKIRDALATQLPDQYRASLEANDFWRADRLSRVFSPWDRDESGADTRNPAARMRHREISDYTAWYRDRLRMKGE